MNVPQHPPTASQTVSRGISGILRAPGSPESEDLGFPRGRGVGWHAVSREGAPPSSPRVFRAMPGAEGTAAPPGWLEPLFLWTSQHTQRSTLRLARGRAPPPSIPPKALAVRRVPSCDTGSPMPRAGQLLGSQRDDLRVHPPGNDADQRIAGQRKPGQRHG